MTTTTTDLKLLDDLIEENNALKDRVFCQDLIIKDLKELWYSGADPAKVPGYCDEYNSLEKP